MSIEKIRRFAKFAFYLGLGGWAALVSACAESTDGHRGDAAAPPADSGKSQVSEAGQSQADAGLGDAAKDAVVAEGGTVKDSSTGATDSGKGGAMWDVICE